MQSFFRAYKKEKAHQKIHGHTLIFIDLLTKYIMHSTSLQHQSLQVLIHHFCPSWSKLRHFQKRLSL
jgi:hypothetical protein